MIDDKKLVWSPYQEDVFGEISSGKHNLLIKALAGSAKTTTLVEAIKRIPVTKDVAFFAFNKHIAEELKTRVTRQKTYLATLHSFGYGLLMQHYKGKLKLTNYKVPLVVDELNKKWKVPYDKVNAYKYGLSKLWDLMRLKGCFEFEQALEICFEHDIIIKERAFKEHFSDLVTKLTANDLSSPKNGKQKEIDFVDMIYLPIKLKLDVRKFDMILVDEAQDLSWAQKDLLLATMHSKSRIVLCGDEHQTIYQFLGSSEKVFNSFLELPDTKQLPLNICYRCPKDVVAEAKTIVNEIEPFEGASQGKVIKLGVLDDIERDSFVLCRNNKPLLILFYKLLDMGIKGACLKDKAYKDKLLTTIKQYRNTDECILGLNDRREFLTEEYQELGLSKTKLEIKLQELDELEQIIKIISRRAFTREEFVREVEHLFDEEGKSIYLLTIHGSKGLERRNVYLIRPDLVTKNSKSSQDWQHQMDSNLHYIAITRARENFFYIPKESFNDESEKP